MARVNNSYVYSGIAAMGTALVARKLLSSPYQWVTASALAALATFAATYKRVKEPDPVRPPPQPTTLKLDRVHSKVQMVALLSRDDLGQYELVEVLVADPRPYWKHDLIDSPELEGGDLRELVENGHIQRLGTTVRLMTDGWITYAEARPDGMKALQDRLNSELAPLQWLKIRPQRKPVSELGS